MNHSYYQKLNKEKELLYYKECKNIKQENLHTARTARFSKKSLGSDVGEIKKMSEKLKKKSVSTPRNVREKWNTVIYYKTPTKHRH
jgi:hypothetical protein